MCRYLSQHASGPTEDFGFCPILQDFRFLEKWQTQPIDPDCAGSLTLSPGGGLALSSQQSRMRKPQNGPPSQRLRSASKALQPPTEVKARP